MARLIDRYDCALFDLDGVLYLGPDAVPGAADAVAGLRDAGVRVGFVTNNAARSAAAVAEHLRELGMSADVSDVVTSAQASARMIAAELAPGAKVLIVGTQALADEIALVGLTPVWSSDEAPEAIVQGYDPNMTWPRLDDACYALQAGAAWFATNTDSNRPTERGRVPGAGAQIAVVSSSVDGEPRVAGKPCRPLLDETIARLSATAPIFVGDRIDTDIMGAVEVGIDSLFVFSGTHGKHDLASAPPEGRPTHVGADARALLAPSRVLVSETDGMRCGDQLVRAADGRLVFVHGVPDSLDGQLDALWAALALLWADSTLDTSGLDDLELVP